MKKKFKFLISSILILSLFLSSSFFPLLMMRKNIYQMNNLILSIAY